MDFIQNFISEEVIYALGWTVMHSLWQGFLIAIVMAIALQLLSKKSAKVRYEIATLSLFLVFVCSVSTFIWHFESASQIVEQELILVGEIPAADQLSEASFLQGFRQSCIDYFNVHLPVIVLIWLLGVGFFVLRLFGGLAYVQRLKYHRSTMLPEYWQAKVKMLAERIPTKKTALIFESAYTKVPLVIGYFKPYILLPIGTINQLDEKEIEAIIAHELAHVFRKDFLLNIFLSFIEVFFYYHPAVWWISGNIRLERENCCDDIAVRVCGNSLVYAKALVRVQELNSYVPNFAMPFSGQKNQLMNRIKRILNQPQNRSNIMEKLTATCFLLIAIMFLSFSANHSDKITKPEHKVISEIMEVESNSDVYIQPNVWINLDTVPDKKKGAEQPKSIEITQENGKITELIIDGEVIPEEDYEKHKRFFADDHKVKKDNGEDSFPSPHISWLERKSNNTSEPLTLYRFKNDNSKKKQTITKGTNENGQVVIIVDSEGTDPVEIIVDEDVIIVEGNELEDGDTAVIIEEHKHSSEGHNNFRFFNGDDRLQFRADSISWRGDKLSVFEFRDRLGAIEQAHIFEKESLKNTYPEIVERMELFHRKNEDGLKAQEKELEGHLFRLKKDKEKLKFKQKKSKELFGELKEHQLKLEHDRRRLLEKNHLYGSLLDDRQFPNHVARSIAMELKKDGLITDMNDFSFSLSNKKLKVNGKKQAASVFKKYQALYERLSGSELKKKSKYQINISQN